MTTGGATKKQAAFINKLISQDISLNEVLEKYLLHHNIARISDLSVKEASEVIGILKNSGEKKHSRGETTANDASHKQLSFIHDLQVNEERSSHVSTFLEARGKKALEELSSSEASDLISDLKGMPAMDAENRGSRLISSRQLKFISSMQKTDQINEKVLRYLKKVRKGSVEELYSWEASDLISSIRNRDP
ncbi:MAG: hypothetical protein M1301_02010 [Candidatus Thermoplasmatota archaeon]|jgi:hypothetical protein|nr:hypothetical protein [Candidatus Thermoplasmatota archaeon]